MRPDTPPGSFLIRSPRRFPGACPGLTTELPLTPTFASPPLVRLLSQWAPAAALPAAGGNMAEQLAGWVSAFDAIGLHTSLRAVQALADEPVAARRRAAPDPADLAADFRQVRDLQSRAIAQAPALPNEFTYAPYRRRHLELQRQMGLAVDALRGRVRDALARLSPALRQLAALDAALDKVIAQREQALLPVAVTVLERRFGQLQAAHLKARHEQAQALPEPPDDDPMLWRRPGAWLHAFEIDWHLTLQAELDLRLEPVAGLVEATGIDLNPIS